MNKIKKTPDIDFDVLVVGGGPAGAASASVFVKNRLKVVMIDGGNIDDESVSQNSADFETVRRFDNTQQELFLGKNLGGINLDRKSHSSNQAKGAKEYILGGVEEFLSVHTQNVEVLQSLAKGGLTEIWGANCDFFNDIELNAIGLPAETREYYQKIIDEIGISGSSRKYKLQPPALADHNARILLENYQKRITKFKNLNLEVHKPYLALLTKNKSARQATKYQDMEYWSDSGKSVYRAKYSIEELEKKRNFYYIKGIVSSVKEKAGFVEVITSEKVYRGKTVVLAAGPLSTSRILIKSFNLYGVKFPFLTKYHIVSACLLLSNLGGRGDIKKHSLCQLIMAATKNNLAEYSYTQFYSYKSLLLFKLLNYSKLPMPESLELLSLLSSCLVLADTRIGSSLDQAGECFLEKNKNGKEVFKINFKKSEEKKLLNTAGFQNVKKGLRSLGLLPIRNAFMPYGSTAHYSGILGSNDGNNKDLKLDSDGKLERANRIYVSDTSGWEALPAKPPTLTIIANSARIATKLSQKIKRL